MSREKGKEKNRTPGKKSRSEKSSYRSADADRERRRRRDAAESENEYTIYDRFANFSEPSETKPHQDDYFSSHYGYVDTPRRPRERTEKQKNKSKASDHRERNYYKDTPRPKELTRSQRKKRIRLSYIVTFFLIVCVAVILSFNVLFKTNEIIVETSGNVPYSDSEIIDKSGLKLQGNIFSARKKAAVKNIVDNLPYVENAEISFKLPGTQVIRIEPAIPSYEVAVNGGFAIISEKGRVLEINPSQLPTIPLLKGLKVTDTEVGKYISFEKATTQQILDEVIANINDNEVPLIYGIDISNAASINLNYDNRITILIGLPEDVGYKLRTAMAIINNQLAPNDKGDLDVSLSNGDRKASYFTPIYSNTVSTESRATASQSSSSSENEEYTGPTTGVRKANSSSSSSTSSEETESYNEDDNYDEEETVSENITGEYGTNYY